MNEHEFIIKDILEENYLNILDLGSGKTSMNILLKNFKNSKITGICYPGDIRKLDSIKQNCKGNFSLIEMDICKDTPKVSYNLVLCHLLLGETIKFGNTLVNMLNSIFKIETENIFIIDYLEDPEIDFNLIKNIAKQNNFKLIKEKIYAKEKEENYPSFIGKNYIGLLFKK